MDCFQTGEVAFTLDNTQSSSNENVIVSVTARPGVPGEDPITVNARLSTSYVSFAAQSTVSSCHGFFSHLAMFLCL